MKVQWANIAVMKIHGSEAPGNRHNFIFGAGLTRLMSPCNLKQYEYLKFDRTCGEDLRRNLLRYVYQVPIKRLPMLLPQNPGLLNRRLFRVHAGRSSGNLSGRLTYSGAWPELVRTLY